jgi:hypothetical protein
LEVLWKLTSAKELEASKSLGAYQAHVTLGIGTTATENAAVLLFAGTSHVYDHAAAISLFHVPGCDKSVSTAQHILTRFSRAYKNADIGPMTVWAILAKDFLQLDEDSKKELGSLRERGAIQARGYYPSPTLGQEPELDRLQRPGTDSYRDPCWSYISL